jgi:3-oxoacyl-[acyl-carrier protein] reductase
MMQAMPKAKHRLMTANAPMRHCGELEEAMLMIAWIVSPACSLTSGFTSI